MKKDKEVFFYRGKIGPSKSIYNRALIVKSFYPQLEIASHFDKESSKEEGLCQDIQDMKNASELINKKNNLERKNFFCGEGGTVLRFLTLRLSRTSGCYRVLGSGRLLSRPHQELREILSFFDVRCEVSELGVEITTDGWRDPQKTIEVDLSRSSQFASGLLLSAWELEFDLQLCWKGEPVSYGYLKMTIEFLKKLGMEIVEEKGGLKVPRGQRMKKSGVFVEADMSSIWAVAALAALCGEAHIQEFEFKSLQPDFRFLNILQEMGVRIKELKEEKQLSVYKAHSLTALSINLKSCPDLFPVLCVLCAFAKGESFLYGATQLKHKESSRIEKMGELLSKVGITCDVLDDGMRINGIGSSRVDFKKNKERIVFDCDQDHRLVMAAGILKRLGYPLEVKGEEAINKSFPGFLSLLGEAV